MTTLPTRESFIVLQNSSILESLVKKKVANICDIKVKPKQSAKKFGEVSFLCPLSGVVCKLQWLVCKLINSICTQFPPFDFHARSLIKYFKNSYKLINILLITIKNESSTYWEMYCCFLPRRNTTPLSQDSITAFFDHMG